MATMEDVGPTRYRTAEVASAGSSITELVAGAAAIVLPILGLVGVLPVSFAAIAFIAIGGAMMFRGGAVTAQSRSLLATAGGLDSSELVGGMSAEILGGAAVSALGIIALVGISPMTLLAISAIVGGTAIVLGAGLTSRLSSYHFETVPGSETTARLYRDTAKAAAGSDVLVGLGAIVLGILVLAGTGSMFVRLDLILVAALALGSALFLNGTSAGARFLALLHR